MFLWLFAHACCLPADAEDFRRLRYFRFHHCRCRRHSANSTFQQFRIHPNSLPSFLPSCSRPLLTWCRLQRWGRQSVSGAAGPTPTVESKTPCTVFVRKQAGKDRRRNRQCAHHSTGRIWTDLLHKSITGGVNWRARQEAATCTRTSVTQPSFAFIPDSF